MSNYKTCFPPIVGDETQVILLGSLPGEVSLHVKQYYAHPRNQFWHLLEDCLAVTLVKKSYRERLQTLKKHHIGLWDVVAQASRKGSLDTALRDVTHNDLVGLLSRLPRLRLVAFNGCTAARVAQRLTHLPFTLLQLPSSSPAYTLPYPVKLDQWKRIVGYLSPYTGSNQ